MVSHADGQYQMSTSPDSRAHMTYSHLGGNEMRIHRVIIDLTAAFLLLGLALPSFTWLSMGQPQFYWQPYLTFMAPAFLLFLLLYLAVRLTRSQFRCLSIACVVALALAGSVQHVLLVPLAAFIVGVTALNIAYTLATPTVS